MKTKIESKADQRVAIAKDALAWINAGALKPSNGGHYVNPTRALAVDVDGERHKQVQLRDMVLGKCEVCALGALFLAKAVRYDNVLARSCGYYPIALRDHFDEDQMNLIEFTFEGKQICSAGSVSQRRAVQARAFYNRYYDPTDRLYGILENIIENRGTFVL